MGPIDDAAFKSIIAKTSNGNAVRTTVLNDLNAFTSAANSQSTRSLITLLRTCIVLDANGKPSFRLAIIPEAKEAKLLISQAGTANPSVVSLKNIIGTITPAYVGVGIYRLTSAAKFTAAKTMVEISQNALDGTTLFKANWIDASTIEIRSYSSGVLTNALLSNMPISISVFA